VRCAKQVGDPELKLSVVSQDMNDVARIRQRSEQAWRWLRKIEAGMKPKDWGEFLPWLDDSENRSVFLECESGAMGRPMVVAEQPPPPEARVAEMILLFSHRK
jgi:hypothetical protein